VAGTVAGMTPK